ncbi:MAG: hypothetical protein U0531_12990 [Dehalococcoidia bacterium]
MISIMSRTARGRRWRIREHGRSAPPPMGRIPLIGRLLALRGVTSVAEAKAFMQGDEVNADPMALRGMPEAVARISRAAASGSALRSTVTTTWTASPPPPFSPRVSAPSAVM